MEQIKDKEIEALELEVKNKLCEFSEIIKQEYDKREEIKDHRKKLCKLYGKIYEKYTGKKVKVVSTNSIGTCELVGFFKGFSFYSYFDATYTVIPSIVLKKVKKRRNRIRLRISFIQGAVSERHRIDRNHRIKQKAMEEEGSEFRTLAAFEVYALVLTLLIFKFIFN